MDNGILENLEGTVIKGNLSVVQADIPSLQGDGSIEGSGVLYINTIQEYNENYGINIHNSTFYKNYIDIAHTQESLNISSGSLLLRGGICINNTSNALSLTSGGTFISLGGGIFQKNVYIGGILDVNANRIVNVNDPINNLDAANKQYVDSITFGSVYGNFSTGQLIVGGSDGSLNGFDNLTYNTTSNLLNFNTNLLFTQNQTDNIFLISSGNLLLYKNLDLNNYRIINLSDPINPLDAVNKQYIDNITFGSINGNFTLGNVLFGGTNGSVYGSDNFTYITNSNLLYLNSNILLSQNQTDNVFLVSSGNLLIYKPTYIDAILDVNNHNIINVSDPINNLDAVNKQYIDSLFINAEYFVLDNNVIDSELPFTIDPNYNSVIIYIYTTHNNTSCIYIIKAYRTLTSWMINTSFVGDYNQIDFSISNTDTLTYTNQNTDNYTSSIRYKIQYFTENTISLSNLTQTNFTIVQNLSFTDLALSLSSILSSDIYIYISNGTDSFALFNLKIVKSISWSITQTQIGNITGIHFNVSNIGNLQYKNTNNETFYLYIQNHYIDLTFSTLTLDANIVSFTQLPSFTFQKTQTNFYIRLYAENITDNKYAFYDIWGILTNDIWTINNQFSGDFLGISFGISNYPQYGILQYKNPNSSQVTIRYNITTNIEYTALPVNKGGTGLNYINPFGILYGNGIDPISSSDEFIFQNNTVELGTSASIILKNTSDASNNTSGGPITILGGASVSKTLYVGSNLYVNNINIKPNIFDILNENTFNASNNQNVQSDIVGFSIPNGISCFKGIIFVKITTTTTDISNLYDLKILKKYSSWIIETTDMINGDSTGLQFFITNSGQVQYTSTNTPNWISTLIKYKGVSL